MTVGNLRAPAGVFKAGPSRRQSGEASACRVRLHTLRGLGFLLAPQFMATLYGTPIEPHPLMLARFFGSGLLSLSVMGWQARHVHDETAIHAILIGLAAGFAVGALLSAWSTLSGLHLAAIGWSTFVLYLLLLSGALYCLAPSHRAVAA